MWKGLKVGNWSEPKPHVDWRRNLRLGGFLKMHRRVNAEVSDCFVEHRDRLVISFRIEVPNRHYGGDARYVIREVEIPIESIEIERGDFDDDAAAVNA